MSYKFSKIVAKLGLLGDLHSTKSWPLHHPHMLSTTGKVFLIFTKGSSQETQIEKTCRSWLNSCKSLSSFSWVVSFICMCVCSVTTLCPTLCDLMDYRLPSSSVHGILQARILEWVAISSSRGSSRPRDGTCISCIAGGFFTTEPPGSP